MKTKENPENKYVEQILDLADRADFMNEIYLFRKKLGIPRNGFATQNAEKKYAAENDLYSHVDPKSKLEIKKLKEEFKDNPYKLDIILSWNELYSGSFLADILNKFKIPKRAHTHLHSFIVFGKNKPLYELVNFLATGYGCQINTAFFMPEFKYNIDGFLFDKDDLSALMFIYPEATKADLKKAIDDNWADIKLSQLEIARRNKMPVPTIHSKIFRNKQDAIIKLHKKGLTSYEIANKLEINQEAGYEYVRQVISRKKRISNPKVMTKDEMLLELSKARKTSR